MSIFFYSFLRNSQTDCSTTCNTGQPKLSSGYHIKEKNHSAFDCSAVASVWGKMSATVLNVSSASLTETKLTELIEKGKRMALLHGRITLLQILLHVIKQNSYQ